MTQARLAGGGVAALTLAHTCSAGIDLLAGAAPVPRGRLPCMLSVPQQGCVHLTYTTAVSWAAGVAPIWARHPGAAAWLHKLRGTAAIVRSLSANSGRSHSYSMDPVLDSAAMQAFIAAGTVLVGAQLFAPPTNDGLLYHAALMRLPRAMWASSMRWWRRARRCCCRTQTRRRSSAPHTSGIRRR